MITYCSYSQYVKLGIELFTKSQTVKILIEYQF